MEPERVTLLKARLPRTQGCETLPLQITYTCKNILGNINVIWNYFFSSFANAVRSIRMLCGCSLSPQAFYEEKLFHKDFIQERFYSLAVRQGVAKSKVEKRLAQDKAREFQGPYLYHILTNPLITHPSISLARRHVPSAL